YTIYSLEGWERYEEKKDGEGDVLIASGTYEYFETPDRNRSILPINVFEIPIARNLGYQMARKFNAIANIESSRDFLIWAANFIRLRIETDDTDEVVNEKLAKGWNWFRGTALEFVNPSSEPTVNASKVIEDKLKQAYLTFFREYGDAARERTATEIRQDIQSGIQ